MTVQNKYYYYEPSLVNTVSPPLDRNGPLIKHGRVIW